jgi:hypothetical protein
LLLLLLLRRQVELGGALGPLLLFRLLRVVARLYRHELPLLL